MHRYPIGALVDKMIQALKMNGDRKQTPKITKARFEPERVMNNFTRFLETFA